MSGNSESSQERNRIVSSIYEAVLHPEKYDLFMTDWANHVERAIERLDGLRITSGSSPQYYSDPVIEGHFRRAFEMLERIGRDSVPPIDLLSRPDIPPLATFSGNEGIVSHSDEATRLFDAPVSIETVATGLDPASARRFNEMVTRLRRAPSAGSFSLLTLAEPNPLLPGNLLAAATRRDDSKRVVLEVRPLAMKWDDAVGDLLDETFNLTSSEMALVRDLVTDGDLAAIASRTGRSRNTLRVHLRSVFHKTRTSSQTELLRLVAALVLFVSRLPVMTRLDARAGVVETEEVEVGDGRRVPVQYSGPTNGRPFLFLHGMLDGLAALPYLDECLTAHNIRLIAPVRNNFGQAGPDGRVREAPDILARDMQSLIARMQLDRVVLLGHMAGAFYAFAVAARLGDRIAGIVNVSGGVPIRSVRQFAVMTPRQRTVAYTARFAPALLPAILRAGIAQIDSKDALQFLKALYLPGTPDRALVEDNPAMARSILDGYRFSVAQGEQAFRIDSWHVTRDWSDIVLRSRCPVLLLHGIYDPVVAFDSVTDFADGSNRMEVAPLDGGQLILYGATRAIFDRIRAFTEQRVDSPD